MEELGIPNNEDRGARQFFENYNRVNNTRFIPTRFMDIGYFADGYDKPSHSWMEYDTPMHNSTRQKARDLIRQINILKHFISTGNPLTQFTRVKVDKNGIVVGIIHVL